MKQLAWVLTLFLALLAATVWVVNFGRDPLNDPPPTTPPDREQVARGAYLARAGNCMVCHTERGSAPYAGGRAIDTPFGTVFASNLTPDAETGLGRWSANQFRRAMQDGVSRDGRLLYPAFPYTHFSRVSTSDVDALYDYLRSLPPVNRPNRDHRLRWPYSTQTALAVWRLLYFRGETFAEDPTRTTEWNRGAYLVQGLGHCGACHTTRDALGGTASLGELAGGTIPMQNWYAPSLSSPTEASMADWPLAEIEQLLRTGTSPRASVMGPMAEVVLHSTQYLEPGDIRAMAVFLKGLPLVPTDTDPREVQRPSPSTLDRGGKVYEQHCAQCHGDKGEGVPRAYPRLAGNRAVTMPVTSNLVQVVLHGGFPPATRGNPRPHGMPPFATQLNDAEVAAVLSYIRGSWGNQAAPVSELAVAQQRGRP